ncbi:hypothetical protein DQK91_11805 [Oceanidesulfovibrio marinus]|uniref:Tetratricopeptide repeat protein n=2 Tax=Oceanidesulfovibrio marinus TaxID=370038 RepID=A0A6P1ZI78_9BACT|nr:hypothetical protein DQK91_11805 [Oceanidesulfovibrio marinus]
MGQSVSCRTEDMALANDEHKTKLSRRELFTKFRPGGLSDWADRVRSRLDESLPDEDERLKGRGRKSAGASPENRAESLPGRALEAISLGQPDEAIAAMRPFVKEHPKNREARLLLGRILYRDGAIVQSRVEFERVVRDSIGDSLYRWPASCASLCLACALARCGKLDKAAARLRISLDEDRPEAAPTLEGLATALERFAKQEDTDDASLDAAVDGLVATLENYIEAAYSTTMEMAADLATGDAPQKADTTETAAG